MRLKLKAAGGWDGRLNGPVAEVTLSGLPLGVIRRPSWVPAAASWNGKAGTNPKPSSSRSGTWGRNRGSSAGLQRRHTRACQHRGCDDRSRNEAARLVRSTGTPRLVGNSPRSMQAPQSLGTRGLGSRFRTIRRSAGIPGKPSPTTSAPGSDQDFPEQGPNRDFACRYPALTQTNDLGNAPSRLKRDLHVSGGEPTDFR